MRVEWTLPSSTKIRPGAVPHPAPDAVAVLRQGTEMKDNARLDSAGYQQREPRVAVRCEAVLLEQDGCALDVTITDVSRDGFRLESRCELEVGSEVFLQVAKLEPVKAVIRWTCGYEAGGVFLEPVSL